MTLLGTYYTYFFESGSNTPSSWGDYRFYFQVYLVNQNSSNVTSSVQVNMYVNVKNYLGYYYAGASVNGGSYGDQGSVYVTNGTKLIGTRSFTIQHNTSDGKGSFTFTGRGKESEYSYIYTSTPTITLPTIPRGTSITSYTRTNITLTSFRVNWASANTVDRVEYRINSGSWTLGQSGDRKSGNFTISGRSPNTTYQVQIRVRRKSSQVWTNSSNVNVKTLDIARITSAPDNIIMGNNITVNYSNPSGSPLSISIYKTDGMTAIAPYRACSGTSYTFTLTETEKNNMYNSIPTTNDTRFRIYIRTEAGSNYLYYVERKFILTNANPIFNNFAYEDINAITTTLTGNNQTIIKGYSTLRAIISTSNKAVAQKGATITKYRLVVGEKQIDVPYSASETVELTLNAIDNNVFTVYAIDSRGNSTLKQISPLTYLAYFKPYYINPIPSASRIGGIGDETTLTFNGSFLNIDFGSEQNNITIAYKYKKTSDEEYIDGTTTITPIINENNFSFENIIAGDKGALGFDSKYSYDIKIIATDELSSTSYDLILGTGKPNLAIHRDGVAFGAPYDEELEGFQIVDKKITFNGLELFKWVE